MGEIIFKGFSEEEQELIQTQMDIYDMTDRDYLICAFNLIHKYDVFSVKWDEFNL